MPYDLPSFARFTPSLRVEDGSPLKLEPFQRTFFADHFGDATELVVVIPKKNYKTTSLAALALFHVAEVPDAECIIVAASRDQAGVMFRQAEKMIRRSGTKLTRTDVRGRLQTNTNRWELAGKDYEIRPGIREIRCNGGRIKVMAADSDTADGAIPTLALVDELHRHRDGELYGVMADGIGIRDGRMVTISTAGATEDSPLGRVRARAHAIGGTKDGRHTRIVDGPFVLHEWALDPEDDPENLRTVKRANPAKLQTYSKLRARRNSPTMTPGRWLRFACGIWTHGEEPPIRAGQWDRCRVEIGMVTAGDEVVLVPSVGHNAAIGIASVREDGRAAVAAEVLDPVEDASMLVRTEDRISELCETYRVTAVHHPLGSFLRSADILAARGIPMTEAPHSPARLVSATGSFNRLLRSGLLMHDGDPILRNHVLAAQTKTTETGERYEIANPSRALVAVALAVHAATAPEHAPPAVAIAWT